MVVQECPECHDATFVSDLGKGYSICHADGTTFSRKYAALVELRYWSNHSGGNIARRDKRRPTVPILGRLVLETDKINGW